MKQASGFTGMCIWGLIFLALATSNCYSQTLQFSQVLLIGSNAQTVPAGKVWKVETALPSILNQNAERQLSIIIDNNTVGIGGSINWGSNLNILNQAFWLPSGTTLAAGQSVFRVSVIEFTVLP
jgi:hypothetical protein